MKSLYRLAALGAVLLLSACASLGGGIGGEGGGTQSRLTILISSDGFRADYLGRGDTPALDALAAEGAQGGMRPSFPTLTFPNHYTLITGKRPDRNGIVNNVMEDPAIPGVRFSMSNAAAVQDPRWWSQALPFWVSVEQQGMKAAAMFWPGSEAEIAGVRPSRWMTFNQALPSNDRVDTLLAWLDDPKGPELRFATLYFDVVDTEGHHYGPDSPERRVATVEVDQAVARLVAGLKARGRLETTDIVLVADHGMASVPPSQRWPLDDVVDLSKLKLVSTGAVVGLTPVPGHEVEVEAALLKPLPHLTCWKKGQIPERYHYGRNPRVPAIVCLSETGWYVTTRKMMEKPGKWDLRDGGQHGFDPYDPAMRAMFIARGPSFKPGVKLPDFDNVDVYPLLARVSGIKPEKGDGSLKVIGQALR
ncbi:ectonucleotide pyrophosphatase/phosphodiesterase [Caulobacter henricii]|uniref:Phosphodiesterase n=1 Tax=Caulobacter henricii TaxID=69395 RepID=A0A0P0NZ63_9CAUL|nr:ectonucleotide pyrophosphatase/phosphodiesterase [Caulobacter henricii]ALL13006.1 phosphodiesterase [Caulobacter henricii]